MTNEDIYDECAPALERFFANKVSAPHEVEDLLQTTFVRLFAKLAQGAQLDDPCAFVGGIAKNVLFEHWRGKTRLSTHEDISEHSLASMGSGLSTLLARTQEQALLLDSLHEIKLKFQMVLELYYWERKSYQEIAALMEIPKGTVGTLLTRGRKQLQRIITRKLTTRRSDEDQGSPTVVRLLERSRDTPSSHARRAPHHGPALGTARPSTLGCVSRADESSAGSQ